jgi:hypothetical protein
MVIASPKFIGNVFVIVSFNSLLCFLGAMKLLYFEDNNSTPQNMLVVHQIATAPFINTTFLLEKPLVLIYIMMRYILVMLGNPPVNISVEMIIPITCPLH